MNICFHIRWFGNWGQIIWKIMWHFSEAALKSAKANSPWEFPEIFLFSKIPWGVWQIPWDFPDFPWKGHFPDFSRVRGNLVINCFISLKKQQNGSIFCDMNMNIHIFGLNGPCTRNFNKKYNFRNSFVSCSPLYLGTSCTYMTSESMHIW